METIAYWRYIGMMKTKLEMAVVYWGYIGIVEKMETAIYPKPLRFRDPTSRSQPSGASRLCLLDQLRRLGFRV